MQKIFPSEYNFFPKTWVLPGDYSDFKSQINKKKIFIVKPEASSQGRGIFLIKKLDEINISERYVVQEYLGEPLLIDGLKFDLRIYVLVTGCNPLKVFIHEDGLTRLATEVYTSPNSHNLEDMCVHLTNYAINKNNPKFEFNTDPEADNIGHKRSLNATFAYLEQQGKDVETLKARIEDIILKTLCSIQPSLAHIYRSCQPEDFTNGLCFELLGFDIIIDKNLNPVLLEVNHSPSFSTDSPLDYKIKHRLIKETLEMLGSRVRDRKAYHQSKKLDPGKKTASKVRETREDKIEKARETVERREKWEDSHLGGFKKLYPSANKDKYDGFINAAIGLWSEVPGHVKKKDEIPKNTSVPKAVIKPKPTKSAPRRPLTLSSTSLQKLINTVSAEEPEGEGGEEETIQRIVKNFRGNQNIVDIKEFIYYKHLEDMLRDRRQAISLLRGSDVAAKQSKPPKYVKNKEVSHGNYIVPKTFDFSPKIVQPTARDGVYKFGRTTKLEDI